MICKKHGDLNLVAGVTGPTCWDCAIERQRINDNALERANASQVGGNHYANQIQHWDFAASQEFDYFQGQITKYVTRWKKKGGLEDLEKARHFLNKYIELNTPKG
jgi:hypothetical protein